ncbi:sensor histidine kinase [Rhizobacter sp. Root404]|uniref:sensor histidine kinase n=1 Tax=Rhizobacter sp. Root404 TaxID=1736528 RepID=UPI0006F7D702|nr:ATP-binding protein [Rhizobacter sp. Root404]KQW35586.1 PAS domain-containing sensor histidine kinase [Rhizobacter sp. Root404]
MNAPPALLLPPLDALAAPRPRRWRTLLWVALVVLLIAAQTLLVALAFHYRSARTQEAVEAIAATASAELAQLFARDLQAMLDMPGPGAPAAAWQARAEQLLVARPELLRFERRDAQMRIVSAVDTRARPPLFGRYRREEVQFEVELACRATQRRGGPTYSHSYYVPQPDGLGVEVMDLCVAERTSDVVTGFVIASYSLTGLLDQLSAQALAPGHDLFFVEADGSRLAHGRMHVGAGVYKASRMIDLPGTAMQLQVDSAARTPSLVPDLVTGLVIGLSVTLFGVVVLLAHDVRKRAKAEGALADALAFRKAMEDSVVTGLRARDLQGRTTYVNPAFCAMVGYAADALVAQDPPPYWPPEQLPEYQQRQQRRLASSPATHSREAFETVFVRRGGERFPAMVFEAPLLDSTGTHTGWMSAVLDLSAQRRVEEVARQQQERLQATARLATAGEMASLLSHELNQPLSAIAAYATGSLNMMEAQAAGAANDPTLWPLLHQAAQRIAEQAERAGRVIKSVHDFVRRREQAREAVGADALIDAILPLVRLQARKSGTRVELDLPTPMARVVCDRAMVEQVLLNLTRNGIQAMQGAPAGHQPVLTLRVRQTHAQWVQLSVVDRGPGIADEVARQLFTPFFTTRSDGMGLGLSVCRTIVEQHGGALDFANLRGAGGVIVGTEFRFTLPAAPGPAARAPLAVEALAS